MGRVAAELADVAVVTSDNPRTEEPAVIAQAVAEGAAPARERRGVLDRREAIGSAVTEAAAADVVLIAGKGHEDYQEIQGVKHHFSDVEVVREAFNERRTRVGGKSA